MRRYLHILLLLLPLFACTRELNPVVPEEPVDDAPEGTVSVTFSFAVPSDEPTTKAYGDDPLDERSRLQTMHLAVFGSSGYYKKYTKATLLPGYPIREKRTFYRDKLDAQGKEVKDDNGNVIQVPFDKWVDVYAFEANLDLANTERVIHFIGNGPATIRVGKSSEVLPSELSGEGETGFWQMVRLPHGIKAQTAIGVDEKGNKYEYYLDQNNGIYGDDPNDRYVISKETLKYFQCHLTGFDANDNPIFKTLGTDEEGEPIYEKGIPLIRNWSKVNLRNAQGSNFTPISFAIVHVPKQGTLVPYGGLTGFIPYYQDKSFIALSDPAGAYAYKGNLPEKENLFDETIPQAKYFNGTATGNVNVKQYDSRFDSNSPDYALDEINNPGKYDEDLSEDDEPAVYLYERPVPTDNMQPSFVIVYGTYFRADDPIFRDEIRENNGWPAREDYDSSNNYEAFVGDHTDEGLSFREYYEGVKCYYKVDFMSGGEYYPILRNFKYQIQINSITARGHSSPEDAAHSAGSADVSANINAAHLADISDGIRRMAIQPWMAKTFIKADEEATAHLKVKFIDDITGSEAVVNYAETRPDKNNVQKRCVSWSFPPEAGFPDGKDHGVIDVNSISIGPAAQSAGNPDVDGWREIKFKVLEPDKHVARTQTLRISCMSYAREEDGSLKDSDEQPLYRDIVITLQPKQEMRIKLGWESVPRMSGQSQVVSINIPDGLAKSMFPLEFIVEPVLPTLTPSTAANTENLPVMSGKSIIPGRSQKTAIQFKRTVTWEEYQGTPADYVFKDETRWRSFLCHFVTNCSDNATTIWVADKEGYFLTGEDNEYSNAQFSNYSSFSRPEFTTSIPAIAVAPDGPANVEVKTGVMAGDVGKEDFFIMEVENLEPVSAIGAEGITHVEGNIYKFVPTAEIITFQFRTTEEGGNVSTTFKSEDNSYVEATLSPWHFRNVGIVDGFERGSNSGSDVAYRYVSPDADKYFLVGFLTDTKEATPQISVKSLQGVKPVDDFTANAIPGAIQANYREKWFQTTAGTEPIALTLSAVGYVEETVSAPRYKGAIYEWDIDSASLQGLNAGESIGQDVTQNQVKGGFSLQVTSKKEGYQAETHANGVKLPQKGRYELKAGITSNNSDVFFYYAEIHYLLSDSTPQKPYDSNVEPNPDGSLYSAYLGNNYVYMWNIPWGETNGSLVMDAPANQDIVITRIILRGFHGILVDSTDTGGGDIGFGGDLNDGGGL